MPPIVNLLLRRLFFILVTLFFITILLYGIVMLTPAETRASLYLPSRLPNSAHIEVLIHNIIVRFHLNDPFPIQYGLWLNQLLHGDWGYSPTLREQVLPALLKRTPATAELTFYSLLFFIPLGVISGVLAGSKHGKGLDRTLRALAFLSTSLPPFILALILLAIFYVNLRWFPPERIDITNRLIITSASFHTITGFYTLDGLLNGRPDITLEAFRHLVLPVITLSLFHWATLTRITRATVIDEMDKEYVIAANARGIPHTKVLWRHVLKNSAVPALNSTVLSAASLITGVFVVELIFRFSGVSEVIVASMTKLSPDAPAALGFSIYSVILVLILMLLLDILQAWIDPRLLEGVA